MSERKMYCYICWRGCLRRLACRNGSISFMCVPLCALRFWRMPAGFYPNCTCAHAQFIIQRKCDDGGATNRSFGKHQHAIFAPREVIIPRLCPRIKEGNQLSAVRINGVNEYTFALVAEATRKP